MILKRKIKIFLILFVLLITYLYVASISLLPDNITLLQGENINFYTLWGVKIKEIENSNPNIGEYKQGKIIQTSNHAETSKIEEMGKIDLSFELFKGLSVKEVSLNVIPKMTVVPLGNAIGLKLYTEGVLIVGMTAVEGQKPYENTGMKEGDRIISINNKEVSTTEDLIETVNQSNGKEIEVTYIRGTKEEKVNITPIQTEENEYKLGLWVRDAAAGVGTASFYIPSNGMFACLGHGITDIDTGNLITISNGELVTTNLVSIQKGEKGKPGEIRGSIEGSSTIGEVAKNTSFGIFGSVKYKNRLNLSANEIEVANRSEIKTGKAEIICEIEQGNKKTYEIEIQKIHTNNNKDNKSMQIKVTDPELLQKTGGIIQRNEWIPHPPKWKTNWSRNPRPSKRPHHRLRRICRPNAKTNASNLNRHGDGDFVLVRITNKR